MKKFRQYLILMLLMMIFIGAAAVSPRNVYAGLKEDSAGEVAIFGKITNQTDKVRVYIYEDETLKIQNASGINARGRKPSASRHRKQAQNWNLS